MSVGATSSRRGRFGVVGAPTVGEKQRRELVDEEQLSDKLRDGLEADDFIIYGKASVEKYDDDNPPQKLEMEAFEEKMDTFFESGIISRRHKDIPVGEPLREWTLDEPTEVVVDDEVLEFEAGDTLETGIHDDELWIVANLRSDSELARETRMGAMTGDLNGFSVTVFCKEWEETTKGQRVTELDWHSVTIGGDEQIKNKDSRFGVAEFKMFEALDDFHGISTKQAERAAVEILQELPTNMSQAQGDTDEKGFWERVREVASQKSEEADADEVDPESEKADEEQSASPEDEKSDEAAEAPEDEKEMPESVGEDEKSDDAEAVLTKVREELGEDDAAVLEKEMEMAGPPVEEDDEEDDERESPAADGELKADEFAEKLSEAGFVTEADLEEKLEDYPTAEEAVEKMEERLPDEVASKSDVEDVMSAAEEVLTDTLPEAQKAAAEDAAEQTAEKMATGETPDPSGGSAADEQDYMEQIQSAFGTNGGN